jgi:RNA polymerase sigma factor (sigma-70 family)
MSFSGLTDFEKWLRFKKGDIKAFSLIYAEYSPVLYLYGLKFTRNNLIVEDSIQDLFTELLKNCRNLGDTDNILFYLLKSFKRKLLRNIQKDKRSGSAQDDYGYDFHITYSIENDLILEDLSNQKSALLTQALKELTPRQKEAIYLKFTKELDYNEVSEMMNISVEACRNLIAKAVRTMKEAVRGKRDMIFFMITHL